jgi:1,2-dihydroxy-3-keto-5-methylthiopentene dioxygenase
MCFSNDVSRIHAIKRLLNAFFLFSTMTTTTAPPEAKKAKTEQVSMKEAPDSEWPKAWIMSEDVEDQKAPNQQDPNIPVDAAAMRALGIHYWKMDADAYTYPTKAIPWDPKDSQDPKLQALRDERGYSYADIITITPEHLPGFEEKIKSFFEEHIHDAEEIRFILDGSGYFDVRSANDEWIRVHVKKGDLMTLPEGIYHRFTCDTDDYIHAMRLFKGHPVWTPFNRPVDDHPSRLSYVEQYLGGITKEESKQVAKE